MSSPPAGRLEQDLGAVVRLDRVEDPLVAPARGDLGGDLVAQLDRGGRVGLRDRQVAPRRRGDEALERRDRARSCRPLAPLKAPEPTRSARAEDERQHGPARASGAVRSRGRPSAWDVTRDELVGGHGSLEHRGDAAHAVEHDGDRRGRHGEVVRELALRVGRARGT